MHIFQMETVAYIINSITIIIVTKTALRHHLIYLFFCSKSLASYIRLRTDCAQ